MKKYTAVYLPPAYVDEIRELSRRTKVPAAEYYRDAIRVYLEAHAHAPDALPRPRHPTGKLDITSVYIGTEDLEAIKALAKAARLTQAALLRDAIALYLEEERKA